MINIKCFASDDHLLSFGFPLTREAVDQAIKLVRGLVRETQPFVNLGQGGVSAQYLSTGMDKITPSIFSRSASEVELGPQSLAHFATSQSIFEVKGLYGFVLEPSLSRVA